MRCLLPLVALLAGLLVPAAPGQASPPAPQCQGKRATIVGHAHQKVLHGTAGADVIVTNGARRVEAGAGSDRICVTQGKKNVVRAGAGNDSVEVNVRIYHFTRTNLGSGRDLFRGGDRRDDVNASDTARDEITTGPGNDHVTGGSRLGMQDDVRLGGGSDVIDVRGERTIGSGRVDAGPGCCDTMRNIDVKGRTVTIDAELGLATSDGATFLRFGGIERYSFRFEQGAQVTFNGTHRGEYVYMPFTTISGDFGGGDDTVVGNFGPAGTHAQFVGGDGLDKLVLEGTEVSFDAAAGLATGGGTRGEATFADFETLHGIGLTVDMLGSDGGEELVAYGCSVTLRGLAGDDVLQSYAGHNAVDEFGCDSTTSELFGDDGDDDLFGYTRSDTLIGGPGNDSADGDRGEDICDAEKELNCEA